MINNITNLTPLAWAGVLASVVFGAALLCALALFVAGRFCNGGDEELEEELANIRRHVEEMKTYGRTNTWWTCMLNDIRFAILCAQLRSEGYSVGPRDEDGDFEVRWTL